MTSCRPASVRSDHTSTCRRVGGAMRANDTVSRCIDSTTGTLFATVGHGGHHPSTFAGGASGSHPSTSRPSPPSMTRDGPVITQEETHPAPLPGHIHTRRTGRLRDTTTNHPSRQHRATTRTPEPCHWRSRCNASQGPERLPKGKHHSTVPSRFEMDASLGPRPCARHPNPYPERRRQVVRVPTTRPLWGLKRFPRSVPSPGRDASH